MLGIFKLNSISQISKPAASRTDQVNQVLWRVLLANLFVAVAKIVGGLVSGSISMLADGFHSAMDGASNLIGLAGSTAAGHPPDHNHPYGHQKYETFATLGIGLLLLLTSWNILQSVFDRLLQGNGPEVSTISFAIIIAAIVFNLAVVAYEKKEGRRLESSLLLADAAHTKSDVFVSLSVLVSLIAAKIGWVWMDALVALVIVGIIGHTGWQIIRHASDILTDCAVIDPNRVERIVLSIEGVQSCHKIRSRGTTQAAHLDLHIQVDGRMSLNRAHQLGHFTKDRLQDEFNAADVLVHVEPTEFAT